MSESWRNKSYYRPRVLIGTNAVLNPQFGDSIVCITGAEQEVLRNLTQYLHRRSTFVDDYGTDYYTTPTNAEWDSIQAIVADLEEKLMGCDDWTQLLTDILEQVTCCCEKDGTCATGSPALQPVVEQYMDSGAMQAEDTYGDGYVVDAKRCAVAQLTYWQAWEFLTEVIQPTQNALSDILVPAVMVLLASMIGTPVLGIPVGLFLAVIWSLIEVWTSGSLQGVQNAYYANENDIICALYIGLSVSYRSAEGQAQEVIANIDGLSPVDKVLLHAMVAPWAIALAAKAHENATDWALSNVTIGACDDCLEGDDWYAIAVEQPDGDAFLDHSAGGNYWAEADVCGSLLSGETVCGVVFTPVEGVGLDCAPMAGHGLCTGDDLFPNTSTILETGKLYYAYTLFTHDDDQAADTLCNGAEKLNYLQQQTGPGDWRCGFNLGWSGVGTRLVRVQFIVYEKSP